MELDLSFKSLFHITYIVELAPTSVLHNIRTQIKNLGPKKYMQPGIPPPHYHPMLWFTITHYGSITHKRFKKSRSLLEIY